MQLGGGRSHHRNFLERREVRARVLGGNLVIVTDRKFCLGGPAARGAPADIGGTSRRGNGNRTRA